MRKAWGAVGVIMVAGAVLTPAAALAATGPTVGTTTTFAVTSGLLTITAPDTASIGSGAPGTTITGSLGTVTVNDNRAVTAATWTATASASAFTTGGGGGNSVIPPADLSYAVGAITTTGTITATGSNITMSTTAQTVVTGSAGDGDNSASWTPTISVAVPAGAVGGIYTGTITHSVA